MAEIPGVGPASSAKSVPPSYYEVVNAKNVIGAYKYGAAMPYMTREELDAADAALKKDGMVQIPTQNTIKARIAEKTAAQLQKYQLRLSEQITKLLSN